MADGRLTALIGLPTLSAKKYGLAGASSGNFIYVLGGNTGSTTNVIEGFSVNQSNGALTALTGEPTLSASKRNLAGASSGNFIYVLGGDTGSVTDVIEGFSVELSKTAGVSVGTSPMMVGM